MANITPIPACAILADPLATARAAHPLLTRSQTVRHKLSTDMPLLLCCFVVEQISLLSSELEGARASTGVSLLCVNVGYKHRSNDGNSNMQPITIKFAVRVGLYLYIILSASCTVDIIDQVESWTPLYTGLHHL